MNEYTFDYVERNRLDAFCKTVLRNEAINYLSELARRRDREKPLDTLPQAEMDKLCTLDKYPSTALYSRPLAMTYISGTSWWPKPLPPCRSRSSRF